MIKILLIVHPGFSDALELITENIKHYKIEVISFNDPVWRGKSLFKRLKLVKKYDILHFFWGYAKLFDFLTYRFVGRTRIINQFMGTDLFNIINRSLKKRVELKICSYLAKFIVVGGILYDDLSRLNIKSEIVYIMNKNISRVNYSFPQDHRAIAYIPSTSKKFFQRELLLKLANDFPDVIFTWFPYKMTDKEYLPSNIKCIAYIQKELVIPEMIINKVFLRLPIHDGGAPLSLIEAMSVGRWPIWSFDFNYVEKIDNYPELKEKFNILIQKNTSNIDAENFVLENYNMDKIIDGFKKLYENIWKN